MGRRWFVEPVIEAGQNTESCQHARRRDVGGHCRCLAHCEEVFLPNRAGRRLRSAPFIAVMCVDETGSCSNYCSPSPSPKHDRTKQFHWGEAPQAPADGKAFME